MTKLLSILGIALALTFSGPAQPVSVETDFECLTQNLYFEARSEVTAGLIAVGQVTLNRVRSDKFPNTVCEVVKQKTKYNCQFSWYCDGIKDVIRDRKSYTKAAQVASLLLNSDIPDITDGALFYHNTTISPGWKRKRIARIGNHIFYG